MKKLNIILIIVGLLLTAGIITFAVLHDSSEDIENGGNGDNTQPTSAATELSGEGTPDAVGHTTGGTPVAVQLMTREAENDWSRFFESPEIEIRGNGTYSGTLRINGELRIIPNLAVSAVGTTVEDRITGNAVRAPQEYENAVVTVNFLKVNGNELALKDVSDIPLIPDSGSPLNGYVNFQLWNGWWEPNQRILTGGEVRLNTAGTGAFLEFTTGISWIEIEFTVSGVGAGSVPLSTNAPVTTDSPAPPATYAPVDHTPSGDFNVNLSAEQLVRDIGLGWNLGNTLDAYNSDDPSVPIHWVDYDDMFSVETAWIGGRANVTTPELIRRVKDAGFNAIRIPVTWYKMAGGAPNYTIREDWMNHVQYIVDMVAAEGMYIILNTHHDEFILRFDQADEGERVMTALWTQIAERFKGYNEKLIFEGLNEPRRRTNSWTSQGQWDWSGDSSMHSTVNRWNQAFVNAVRATGGNNSYRHLMLATYAAQSQSNALNNFRLPTDPVSGNGISKFILSVHTYSPHGWAHNGQGSYGGASEVQRDLDRVANRAAELGIPVILGEFGTVARNSHSDRVTHAHDYVRIATEMRGRSSNPVVMACFWWDDHSSFRLISRTSAIDSNGLEIIRAMTRARNGQGR
jgi:endoglucanase